MSKLTIMGTKGTIEKVVPKDLGIKIEGGDTAVAWETKDKESVEVADRVFSELIAANFLGFNADTSPPEQIKEFDPSAEEIVMSPQIAGG